MCRSGGCHKAQSLPSIIMHQCVSWQAHTARTWLCTAVTSSTLEQCSCSSAFSDLLQLAKPHECVMQPMTGRTSPYVRARLSSAVRPSSAAAAARPPKQAWPALVLRGRARQTPKRSSTVLL